MKVECKFMMIMISNEPNQNNAAKPNRKFSFCVSVFGWKKRKKWGVPLTNSYLIFIFGIFRRLVEKPEYVRRDKMYDEDEEESESGLGE